MASKSQHYLQMFYVGCIILLEDIFTYFCSLFVTVKCYSFSNLVTNFVSSFRYDGYKLFNICISFFKSRSVLLCDNNYNHNTNYNKGKTDDNDNNNNNCF